MTSVWVVSVIWHLSNDTKALFADEFVDKDYSIYTEMFWQTFMCTLPQYFSTLKDQLMFQGSCRNKRLLVLEKALLDI